MSLEALSPWEHQENERFRVRRPIRELADISTDRGIMPEALVRSDLRSGRAPRSLIIGNNVMLAPTTFEVRVPRDCRVASCRELRTLLPQ